MECPEFVEVDGEERIPVHYDDVRVACMLGGQHKCTTRAQSLRLLGVQHVRAVPAHAEMITDPLREITHRQHESVDALASPVLEQYFEKRSAIDWCHRLRQVANHWPKTGA